MKSRRLAFAAALLVPSAQAQAQAPVQALAEPKGIEQIIVTAKKRRENAQLVPQVVDVVRGTALRRYQLNQFQDLEHLVAGLQLSDSTGRGQNVTLRGVAYNADTTANPSVDLYVNEVPISQTSTAFQDLYDIDQVQVVRGPQGTLRGRTSPAGAILIETRKPDLDVISGEFAQSFSDDGLIRTEAAAGAPLVAGKLAVRAAFLFNQNDLYQTDNIIRGQKDFNLQHGLRLSATVKPADDLDITIMHQSGNDRTAQFQAVSGAGNWGSFTPRDNVALSPGPYSFYDRTDLTTLQASWHLPGLDLVYVGGYQAVDDEFAELVDTTNFLPDFDYGNQTLHAAVNQLTQDFRLQSTGHNILDYMVGFYYAHQDANAFVVTPSEVIFAPTPGHGINGLTPVGSINAYVYIPQLATDYAIFTDETLRLSDYDIVEGGLRWQFERQYRSSNLTAILPPEFLGGGTVEENLISDKNRHEEYRAWTGLASYTHRFTPNAQIYASYGQSFRPGGVVLGITLPLPEDFLLFKPESSYDFEIGGKTTWFDGRLRVNADIYHQAYTNYIGRLDYLYTIYGNQNVTTNGNAIARGAEMSINAVITEDWQADINLSYADAHYDNAHMPCNDYAGTGQPNRDGTPRVTGGGLVSYCNVNASLGAPPFSFSIGSTYSHAVTDGVEGFLRGLYTFEGAATNVLAPGNQDPRNMINLYAGLRGTARKWELSLFVKNLLGVVGYTNLVGDQRITGYTTDGAFQDLPTGYASSKILRPREVGATLSYRF